MPVAVILGLLGLLPGMPHFLMLPAAAAAGFAAWRLRKIAANRPKPVAAQSPAEPVDLSKIGWDEVTDNMQVMLDIGYGLVPLVDERRGGPLMAGITGGAPPAFQGTRLRRAPGAGARRHQPGALHLSHRHRRRGRGRGQCLA